METHGSDSLRTAVISGWVFDKQQTLKTLWLTLDFSRVSKGQRPRHGMNCIEIGTVDGATPQSWDQPDF